MELQRRGCQTGAGTMGMGMQGVLGVTVREDVVRAAPAASGHASRSGERTRGKGAFVGITIRLTRE